MDEQCELKIIKKARHCIGMDQRKTYRRHGKVFYRPYRNYYAVRGEDLHWEWLVSHGFAKRELEGIGAYYCLTRAGLDWLGEKISVKIYDEER